MRGPQSASPIDRMTERSSVEGECLVWTGSCTLDGYGHLSIRGRKHYVHRLAYEISHGPIPRGMQVLHSCDNPPCWRLSHLSLGTVAQNTKEAWDRGLRRRPTMPRLKRSLNLDPDMADWLEARAEAASASQSTIIRQILRTAMQAEAECNSEAA